MAEIISRKKIENAVMALAKANFETVVTDKTIKKLEKIAYQGLRNTLCDKDILHILSKQSEQLIRKVTLERESSYKDMTDINERIMIECRIEPESKADLWEKLKNNFSKKLFDKTIEQLISRGHLYEKHGKLYPA